MTPAQAIRALASGDPAAASALLPACRAEAYGTEAFGPTAIAALFARNPAPLSRDPDTIAASACIALFDADPEGREQAWFADLHGAYIARLWRVGPGPRDTAEPQPHLVFATDPTLSQQRQPVAFRAEDHPDLAPDSIAPLLEAAAVPSCRIAVLRAISAADRVAALLVCLGDRTRLAALALRHAETRAMHARMTWDESLRQGQGLCPWTGYSDIALW